VLLNNRYILGRSLVFRQIDEKDTYLSLL